MPLLHLPSLQAAAVVACATPTEKAPLRLVHVVPGLRGHRYLSTADGKIAFCAEHHARQVVKATTIAGDPIVGDVPIEGTQLPRDRRLLIWAPSVPLKKPTKAELQGGGWIDPEAAGLLVWSIGIAEKDVRLGADGPKLPNEPGLTHLLGVPRLEQIAGEFIAANLHAGTSKRINATYTGLLCKAAEIMARGLLHKGTCGETAGDTPALEWFERERRETTPVFVDLTAQRWHDETLPQAWALVMPIQRRDHEAQTRGIQPT